MKKICISIVGLLSLSLQSAWVHNLWNTLPVPVKITTRNESGILDSFILPANTHGKIHFGGACLKSILIEVPNAEKDKLGVKAQQTKKLAQMYHVYLWENRCTWHNFKISYNPNDPKAKQHGSYLLVKKAPQASVDRDWPKKWVSLNDLPRDMDNYKRGIEV